MRIRTILTIVLLAVIFGACSQLKDNYDVSQRIHTRYPDATVKLAFHSDGSRGLVVSFNLKGLSDFKKADPRAKALELAGWVKTWHDKGESWKDVKVIYKRALFGHLFTMENSETVDIDTLHSK